MAFHLDYVNGLDATTNTPLGWWSVAFNNGTGNAPTAADAVTGATSGHHGHLTEVGSITGTWAGNNAAGIMYFYGCDDLLHSGEQIDWHDGHAHTTGAAVYCAWKTLTLGATLARIAPGDIIKIAKSPAPTALAGTTATWTNLSKTVTLNAAETLEISDCDTNWSVTGHHGTSATASATDWKEGTNKVSVVNAASPLADWIQAFFATGTIAAATISAYQGITFWIKNEVAILANQWEVNLCSDTGGATSVDVFPIPAIPSTGRWIPLTIFRNGGGNLGNNNGTTDIKSINVSLGSAATVATASKYVYIDNFNAVKTGGLNLQSLISKNSAEQGGTEGWFGIQSIVGTTVLLDNDTNTLANAGRGYSGASGSANTYKRETIKTDLASAAATVIQDIMDAGTYGNNIQFQAGYDTSTGEQTGETFFDGLNGYGYGIQLSSKNYVTLNYLNVTRYDRGVYFAASSNNTITTITNANNNNSGVYFTSASNSNTITTITNANNNTSYGVVFNSSNNNTITTITNANNNTSYGVVFSSSNNNTITTITNANNNNTAGVSFSTSNNNTITTITNANNNNAAYGVSFSTSNNNTITTITTTGNTTTSIYINTGRNYINSATIAEGTKVTGFTDFVGGTVFINKLNGNYAAIYTDGGTIVSKASTLTAGSGTEWLFTTADNTNRQLNYPLKLTIAKIAMVANKEVTVTCYFKKGHATNIGARLVFPAQLGEVEHYTTCPSDTSENNLSLSFTPTEAGVGIIEAWAYYVAGHSTVIVDKITMTQAA